MRMGDVISLNKARKAKVKADAQNLAEANRAKFGRTKAEKARDRADRNRIEGAVDGAKLEKD